MTMLEVRATFMYVYTYAGLVSHPLLTVPPEVPMILFLATLQQRY